MRLSSTRTVGLHRRRPFLHSTTEHVSWRPARKIMALPQANVLTALHLEQLEGRGSMRSASSSLSTWSSEDGSSGPPSAVSLGEAPRHVTRRYGARSCNGRRRRRWRLVRCLLRRLLVALLATLLLPLPLSLSLLVCLAIGAGCPAAMSPRCRRSRGGRQGRWRHRCAGAPAPTQPPPMPPMLLPMLPPILRSWQRPQRPGWPHTRGGGG